MPNKQNLYKLWNEDILRVGKVACFRCYTEERLPTIKKAAPSGVPVMEGNVAETARPACVTTMRLWPLTRVRLDNQSRSVQETMKRTAPVGARPERPLSRMQAQSVERIQTRNTANLSVRDWQKVAYSHPTHFISWLDFRRGKPTTKRAQWWPTQRCDELNTG